MAVHGLRNDLPPSRTRLTHHPEPCRRIRPGGTLDCRQAVHDLRNDLPRARPRTYTATPNRRHPWLPVRMAPVAMTMTMGEGSGHFSNGIIDQAPLASSSAALAGAGAAAAGMATAGVAICNGGGVNGSRFRSKSCGWQGSQHRVAGAGHGRYGPTQSGRSWREILEVGGGGSASRLYRKHIPDGGLPSNGGIHFLAAWLISPPDP